MGRFASADPRFLQPLRVANPQRLNLYAYAVNNPHLYVDPDGRDVVLVNFSTGAGGFGHSGFVSVQSNGKARFADFESVSRPFFQTGSVQRIALDNVRFSSSGDPDLTALATDIAAKTQRPANTVSLAYFRTTDAEALALDSWAKGQEQNPPKYALVGYNCLSFCADGFTAAGLGNLLGGANSKIRPNVAFTQVQSGADFSFGPQPDSFEGLQILGKAYEDIQASIRESVKKIEKVTSSIDYICILSANAPGCRVR